MINDEIIYFKREKSKFNDLLNEFGWTEDCLLSEKETLIQCPIDRGHRFPAHSKHVQNCQLVKEGFSKDYLKELGEYKQEKQLLKQSDISFTPSILSQIIHRSLPIKNDIPLNIEQTTILLTPNERCLIAQSVQNEAMRLGIVPSITLPNNDNHSIESEHSNLTQQIDKLAELRDQKRRRQKYTTRTNTKSLYDSARDMINNEMNLIEQMHHQIKSNKDKVKKSKHKHRSSSKKKHRSSRSTSNKHHRHSKKRRTS